MGVTCKDVADKLLLFRDGDLDEGETAFLRQHLHLCPTCMDLLRSYEEVVEVLHRLQPAQMPEGLLDRLKRRMQEG